MEATLQNKAKETEVKMTVIWWSALSCSLFAYFWRTYQWSKQREEIESLKLDIDAAQAAYNELGSERDKLRAKCEQLTLDLAAVRGEAEERGAQLGRAREEIDERNRTFDELYNNALELERTCEQLTLDLAIVRREAEERAKELAEYKAQHAIEERRALQWEKNYYGVRDDMRQLLAQWS
jgi:chromosome segregation ATPase